jgi:peptide/nickel transport system permease protein
VEKPPVTFLKRYLIPRLLQYLVVIFVGVTIVFISTRLAPADPVEQTIQKIQAQGGYMDPRVVEDFTRTLRELYGLQGNIFQQYGALWRRLATLDFGRSFTYFPTPVLQLIRTSLPWTLGLLCLTLFTSWTTGTILGGMAGYASREKWVRALESVIMVIRPIPYYILALIALILFAYVLPIFPISGAFAMGRKVSLTWSFAASVVTHGTLPALSLVAGGIGVSFIQMKSMASNIVAEDYVTFGRAGGLSRRKLVFRYTIRNAMLPQITGLALSLGQLFSGNLVVENVFSYPGVGMLLYQSITQGDYNLTMGITMFSILVISTGVLVIDLVYPLFDPRVRYQ